MTGDAAAQRRTASSPLADLRREAGLSQEELAEAAGIGVRTLRDIERGVAARPRRDTIRRLADALRLTADERERFEAHFRGEPTRPWFQPTPPRQLPHDITAFGGREAELDQLDGILQDADAQRIVALAGPGGVGKSALAARWAHRVTDRFPDGQLWIDLHGFDAERSPVDPTEALARFLRALGVDSEGIPADADEREMLYRSLLDGRRLLVVLDNARDSQQVSRLLPGSATCRTLVTSRDSLTGLVARHGAHRLAVDALPVADAVVLLESLIGDRALDDPAATAAVAERCARLPLALRIAAELASVRREPVAVLADSLADARRRLDLLDAGADERTAIRAVFSWSYENLADDVSTAFRLLGLHPGTEIDTYAAAALLDRDVASTRQILDRLIRAHLLDETQAGRFAMHDLLRAWAAELVREGDSEEDRQVALTRLFDHYRYLARVAMGLYNPAGSHRIPDVADPGRPVPDIDDRAPATTWLNAERQNLLAVATVAADQGWPDYTSDLSIILFRYLDVAAHDREAESLHTLAVRVTSGNAKARATNQLGITYWNVGRYTEAIDNLETALALCRKTGDETTEGAVLGNLGGLYDAMGRYDDAIRTQHESLDLKRRTGDRNGEGLSHNNLGTAYVAVGDYERALSHHRQALEIARELEDRPSESRCFGNLGEVYVRLGRYEVALRHHLEDLAITRELGDRIREAVTLNHLGIAYARLERYEEALARHEESLAIALTTGRRRHEVATLNDMGDTLRAMGRLEDALSRYENVLAIVGQADERYERARALEGIGHVRHDRGEVDRARERWRQALAAYEDLGVTEAKTLSDLLTATEH